MAKKTVKRAKKSASYGGLPKEHAYYGYIAVGVILVALYFFLKGMA